MAVKLSLQKYTQNLGLKHLFSNVFYKDNGKFITLYSGDNSILTAGEGKVCYFGIKISKTKSNLEKIDKITKNSTLVNQNLQNFVIQRYPNIMNEIQDIMKNSLESISKEDLERGDKETLDKFGRKVLMSTMVVAKPMVLNFLKEVLDIKEGIEDEELEIDSTFSLNLDVTE